MVAKCTSDKELEGKIVCTAYTLLLVGHPGVAPVRHNAVTNGIGERFIFIDRIASEIAPEVMGQISLKRFSQCVFVARKYRQGG